MDVWLTGTVPLNGIHVKPNVECFMLLNLRYGRLINRHSTLHNCTFVKSICCKTRYIKYNLTFLAFFFILTNIGPHFIIIELHNHMLRYKSKSTHRGDFQYVILVIWVDEIMYGWTIYVTPKNNWWGIIPYTLHFGENDLTNIYMMKTVGPFEEGLSLFLNILHENIAPVIRMCRVCNGWVEQMW